MRASSKKILRIIAVAVLGILVLILVAGAGAIIWLRTDTGARTLANLGIKALADQGIFIKVETLSGPLPSRLHVTGLVLADADGDWLVAREADIHIDLKALLTKTVAVSMATVDSAVMYRLPHLTPAQTVPEPAPVPEKPGYFTLNLPVSFRIDKLVAKNPGVYAAVVFPGSEQGPEPGAEPGPEPDGKPGAKPGVKPGTRPATQSASEPDAADRAGSAEPATEPGPGPIFSAEILDGNATFSSGGPIEAAVTVGGLVADMAQLSAHTVPLPFDALTLEGTVQAEIGEAIAGSVAANLLPSRADEEYPFRFQGEMSLLDGALTLPKILVDGLGMRLEADGGYALNTGAASLNASVITESRGKWERLLETFTGLDLGGTITAKADAALDEAGTLHASVEATGNAMHWWTPELQEILGPSLALKASGGGGGASQKGATNEKDTPAAATRPYVLALENLTVGTVRASGDASYDPEAGTLAAAAHADVPDIARFVPEITGAVTADAKVTGSVAAPSFTVALTSKAITQEDRRFGGVEAAVRGTASLGTTTTVRATANASVTESPAGPVTFHSGVMASQDGRGTLAVQLSELALAFAGTDVTADIDAVLPGGSVEAASIKGNAKARILDWKPFSALTGVPLSGSRAGFDATFSHDSGTQTIDAVLRAGRVEMPGSFSVSRVNGKLNVRNLANPDITMNVTVAEGEAGPVGWATGAASVQAANGTGTFAVALRADKSALAALRNLSAPGSGRRPGRNDRLSAGGQFALDPLRVTLNRLEARLPDSPTGVYLTAPATVSIGDAIEVGGLSLAVVPGKGTVTAKASFGPTHAQAEVTVSALPLRPIREMTEVSFPDGTIDAAVNMTRNGSVVSGNGKITALVSPVSSNARTPATPAILTVLATLDRDADPNFPQLQSARGMARLKGNVALTYGEDPQTTAAGPTAAFNIPMGFAASGIPALDTQAPFAATVAWLGEIAPVWAVLPFPEQKVSGKAQVDASASGSLSKPEYTASAYVTEGRVQDSIYGILLTNIALEAESASGKDSKIVLRAEDPDGGYAALEGVFSPGVSGDPGQVAVPRISARGQINHLQPLQRDDLFLRFSGLLSANGPVDSLKIGADIEIERGEASLLTSFGGGVRTLEISNPDDQVKMTSSGPVLDVKVSVPHRFYIRGRGLDSEWQGNLKVTGPVSSPSLTGSLMPVRGTFDLLSRPFDFEKGDITFFGGDRINPGLNLTLSYTGSNITAYAHARGTANRPQIVLESQPPLPQDQILAEVLFGKEFSRLSRFEALQVANSLRQLANIGGGGLDVLTTMRTKLGVDMLRVGSSNPNETENRSISGAPGADAISGGTGGTSGDDTSTPTVEAGKYINEAIYVGVEQGIDADSTGVRVEVELRPNLTLQGKTTPRSSQVGIGWKRDY